MKSAIYSEDGKYNGTVCGNRVIIHNNSCDVEAIIMTNGIPTEDDVKDILKKWDVFMKAGEEYDPS